MKMNQQPTFKFCADRGYQSLDGKGRPLFNVQRKRRIKSKLSFKVEMQAAKK